MLFSAGTSHTKVTLQLIPCGLDWQAILCGGDRPHIGAVVLAVPRPSLKDALVLSCDCWVNPVTAHKDHLVAQPLAETLCIACGIRQRRPAHRPYIARRSSSAPETLRPGHR